MSGNDELYTCSGSKVRWELKGEAHSWSHRAKFDSGWRGEGGDGTVSINVPAHYCLHLVIQETGKASSHILFVF
jgi:hypothetical protein